LCFLNHR